MSDCFRTCRVCSAPVAWGCVHSRWLEKLVGGVERELYREGRFNERQMSAALVTEADVLESNRRQSGTLDLAGVRYVFLERNGEISIIRERKS